jgi:hypothetical protein
MFDERISHKLRTLGLHRVSSRCSMKAGGRRIDPALCELCRINLAAGEETIP